MSADSLKTAIAVVLAGGLGTRIRHVLPTLPKPMAPVAGRPFIEWVVRYLAAQGVRHTIISTGYKADIIDRHFKSQPVTGTSVVCVAEPEPLGTAGAFLHATRSMEQTGSSWLVLNGDSLAFADLSLLPLEAARTGAQGAILGLSVNDSSRYGLLTVSTDGNLTGFAEKRPGSGLINAGVYYFCDSLRNEFPKSLPLSFEKDVFPAWIRRKMPIKVVTSEADFLDIGTEESLSQANDFVRSHANMFKE